MAVLAFESWWQLSSVGTGEGGLGRGAEHTRSRATDRVAWPGDRAMGEGRELLSTKLEKTRLEK